jgi:hypothetical protein
VWHATSRSRNRTRRSPSDRAGGFGRM